MVKKASEATDINRQGLLVEVDWRQEEQRQKEWLLSPYTNAVYYDNNVMGLTIDNTNIHKATQTRVILSQSQGCYKILARCHYNTECTKLTNLTLPLQLYILLPHL